MSDRRVREQRYALEQRLAHTESNLRAVRLRAWPGAVRTDATFTAFAPQVFNVLAPLITLNIPSGRWIALGSVTIIPTPPVESQYQIFLQVVDAATGIAPTHPLSDTPSSDIFFGLASSYPTPSQTATIIGDVIADAALTITLSSVSNSNNAYSVRDARLRMLPV
jgi:hypothetical protein